MDLMEGKATKGSDQRLRAKSLRRGRAARRKGKQCSRSTTRGERAYSATRRDTESSVRTGGRYRAGDAEDQRDMVNELQADRQL